MENQLKWISTSDYLPNPGDIVLIYTKEKIHFDRGQRDVIVQPAYIMGNDAVVDENGYVRFMPVYGEANAFQQVTHWMPLPEKP